MSNSSQFIDPNETIIDNDTGQVITPTAAPDQIAVLAKAEIDQQIATAKMYPRSEDKSLKKAESLACRDDETAGSMFYSIPRAGKFIQGPSIRLAEIMAATWGNLRVQTRTVDANDRFVTVQAVAHDLENNTAVLVEKRRRVLAKKGKAADDDSIQLAGLAGQSIVFRDAIFKIVPRVYVDQIFEKAQKTSVGKAESIVATRKKWVDYFAKIGVPQERVLAAVNASGLEDLDIDKMVILRGLQTSIKEGTLKIEEAFPDPAKPKEGNAGAAEALKSKQQQQSNGKSESSKTGEEPKSEPNAAKVAATSAPQTSPADADSPGEVPQWVLDWEKRIQAMSKFSPATLTLDELLKEYRGADEDKKGMYFELFDAWLVKTLPFADKPSLLPLLIQKLEQVKPYVPEDVFNGLITKVTKK